MAEGGKLQQQIEQALRTLAQNEGVQRRNLKDLLAAELKILTTVWILDLAKESESVRDDVRNRIYAHLRSIDERVKKGHIALPGRRPKFADGLSPEQRLEQFHTVVRVLFNIQGNFATTTLAETGIMRRYEWLAGESNHRGKVSYQIKKPAAEGDFKFAVGHIAKDLASKYEAATVVRGTSINDVTKLSSDDSHKLSGYTAEPTITASLEGGAEVPGALQDEPDKSALLQSEVSLVTGRQKQRRRALVASFGILVLIGGVLIGGELSGLFDRTASDKPSSSTSTGQLPVVSSTTGPVMVTSVAYMRDNGTPGAWSYAFAQVLSSKDVASYGSVSHDEQKYQQWAFSKGGVTTDDDRLQIGLRGNDSGTVVIQDIQVTKHCTTPLMGTLLHVPPQGQSGDLGIYFDLDQQFPVAEDAETHASYFGASGAGHTITLAHDEVATLLLDAVTSRQYCTFSLSLIIDTGTGQEVSETVNDHGKPFQVTAAAGTGISIPFSRYRAVYIQNGAENALVPANPATFGQTLSSSSSAGG